MLIQKSLRSWNILCLAQLRILLPAAPRLARAIASCPSLSKSHSCPEGPTQGMSGCRAPRLSWMGMHLQATVISINYCYYSSKRKAVDWHLPVRSPLSEQSFQGQMSLHPLHLKKISIFSTEVCRLIFPACRWVGGNNINELLIMIQYIIPVLLCQVRGWGLNQEQKPTNLVHSLVLSALGVIDPSIDY